ncbi:MAG: HAD hydrolase family protein [Armatimonadetes bacterium]|nr:HAD hydrolase family protein [Armatimonadota bacterium]
MAHQPIVFSDIDFTIVFDSKLDAGTAVLIEEVRRRARFILVTARSRRECEPLPPIPNDGLIAENGADIWFRRNGEDHLDEDWHREMSAFQPAVYEFRDMLERMGWRIHRKLHSFSSCIEKSGKTDRDVEWVRCNLPEGLQLDFSRNTSGRYIEVFPALAGKDKAVVRLCEDLGVPVDVTLGMGDNSNDIPMLRTVGIPLAPGNCHPDVRALVLGRGGFVSPQEGHSGAQEMLEKAIQLLGG